MPDHQDHLDILAMAAARARTADHQLLAAIRQAYTDGLTATRIAAVVGWPVSRVRRAVKNP